MQLDKIKSSTDRRIIQKSFIYVSNYFTPSDRKTRRLIFLLFRKRGKVFHFGEELSKSIKSSMVASSPRQVRFHMPFVSTSRQFSGDEEERRGGGGGGRRRNEFSSQWSLLGNKEASLLVEEIGDKMRAMDARPSSHYRPKIPFSPFVFASSFQGWLCDPYFPLSNFSGLSSLKSTLYFLGIVYQASDSNLSTNNASELWFLLLKLVERCFVICNVSCIYINIIILF